MAISTLAALKEKALIYMKDRSDLAPFIQDGVDLATDYFSQRLRVREMVQSNVLIPNVDGQSALPKDFVEMITLTEDTSFGVPLDYQTNVGVGATYYSGAAGIGMNYSLLETIPGGFGQIQMLKLYPTTTRNVNILYYAKIPALVNDEDTNWLLQKFPNLYLDYCRMFAADIAEDPNEAKYGAKVDAFIDLLNERNQTAMYGRVTTDLSDEMVVP
jgi:hypothetical protein